MNLAPETAIKVSKIDGQRRPVIVRGDMFAWTTTFRTSARSLGKQVADELCELTPLPSDEQVVEAAAELASQEPPLSIILSWHFYDGVREFLEDRRAEAAYVAQPPGESA